MCEKRKGRQNLCVAFCAWQYVLDSVLLIVHSLEWRWACEAGRDEESGEEGYVFGKGIQGGKENDDIVLQFDPWYEKRKRYAW